MQKTILVVAEKEGTGLCNSTHEILSEASELARRLDFKVAAVLMGQEILTLADEIARMDVNMVYLIEHTLLSEYTTDGYTKVLSELIREKKPEIVLMGGTPNGLDLAARTAARLEVGLVTGCTAIVNRTSILEITKPIFEDRIYSTLTLKSRSPIMIAFKPGVIGRKKSKGRSAIAEVIRIKANLVPGDIRTKVVKSFKAPSNELDVAETDVLVVGGRGVNSAKNWHLIEELAEALEGATAGTRMALDEGWINRAKLIGQTGRTVSPRVCIEAGVSGAIQHNTGLRDAGFIIAINNDRNAPIFKFAHLGVVADLHRLIPNLVARLRQLRLCQRDQQLMDR
jgi:electron transfer flavoprotein alpha subunit